MSSDNKAQREKDMQEQADKEERQRAAERAILFQKQEDARGETPNNLKHDGEIPNDLKHDGEIPNKLNPSFTIE